MDALAVGAKGNGVIMHVVGRVVRGLDRLHVLRADRLADERLELFHVARVARFRQIGRKLLRREAHQPVDRAVELDAHGDECFEVCVLHVVVITSAVAVDQSVDVLAARGERGLGLRDELVHRRVGDVFDLLVWIVCCSVERFQERLDALLQRSVHGSSFQLAFAVGTGHLALLDFAGAVACRALRLVGERAKRLKPLSRHEVRASIRFGDAVRAAAHRKRTRANSTRKERQVIRHDRCPLAAVVAAGKRATVLVRLHEGADADLDRLAGAKIGQQLILSERFKSRGVDERFDAEPVALHRAIADEAEPVRDEDVRIVR